MKPERTLIVFVKAPRIGRVKSRLARDLGRVPAWSFYRREAMSLIRRLAADRRWRVVLAVTPDAWRQAPVWPPGPVRTGQGRGGLGPRMLRALRAAGPGPAVLVGSDIAVLDRRHIWRAFRLLGRAPVVFGPAEDGGYWLVGARHGRDLPDIFANVRWSGPHALADTVGNIPAPRSHVLCDTLWDVDTIDDHRRLAGLRARVSRSRS